MRVDGLVAAYGHGGPSPMIADRSAQSADEILDAACETLERAHAVLNRLREGRLQPAIRMRAHAIRAAAEAAYTVVREIEWNDGPSE